MENSTFANLAFHHVRYRYSVHTYHKYIEYGFASIPKDGEVESPCFYHYNIPHTLSIRLHTKNPVYLLSLVISNLNAL